METKMETSRKRRGFPDRKHGNGRETGKRQKVETKGSENGSLVSTSREGNHGATVATIGGTCEAFVLLTDSRMILKNPKHERFAQALASGKTLEAAHREAGYSGNRSVASRLSRDANICERLEELRGEVSQALTLDRAAFISTLRDRFMRGDPLSPVTARYGELLAKAQGWNAPEKISFAGDVRVVIGGSAS